MATKPSHWPLARSAYVSERTRRLYQERSRSHQLEHFVERPLSISFQIERDVFESQLLEDHRELSCHFECERARQLVFGDLDAHNLPVKPYAKLPEAERLDLLFSLLHRLDVLDRHGRPVGNSGTKARRRRAVPRRQPGLA